MDGKSEHFEYAVIPENLRVCDMPAQLRPREEFERVGAENVSDAVLLALILRTGSTGMNVVEVSRRLLSSFGSLTALARASVKDLQAIESIGPVKAQMIKASMELAQRLTRESVGENPLITTPEQAAAVLRERARVLQHEIFWALMLDTKNRLIGEPKQISQGTLNSSLVHPRELFKRASAALLRRHHPRPQPSFRRSNPLGRRYQGHQTAYRCRRGHGHQGARPHYRRPPPAPFRYRFSQPA